MRVQAVPASWASRQPAWSGLSTGGMVIAQAYLTDAAAGNS